jgi:hypothetical protein
MATIYVVGPVNGKGRRELPAWVQQCYEAVRELKNNADLELELLMPEADATLDKAEAKDFHRQIAGRISSADAVVTIHSSGDSSAAVESCLASVFEKKQLILTADEKSVPRLLRGQPGVAAVVECSEWADPKFAIEKFVSRFAR